ncbi:MAG: radical SAM/SPASM domain-containing protein [Promethearchaeota archaeon]
MGDCACDVTVDQLAPSAPLSHFFLELTAECNNACPGCGSMYAHQRKAPGLPASDWHAVIDRLSPMTPHLRLSGGEPTLHPEFEEIVTHINTLGIPFTVFTNARWTDPEATTRMLINKKFLEGILVSIHGAQASSHEAFTATSGSFEEAVDNVRRAAREGLRVVTSTVITHQNHREMEEIVALAQLTGVERATFSRFIGPPLPEIEASEGELKMAVRSLEPLMDGETDLQHEGQEIRYGAPIPHCFTGNQSNGCMAGFVHATIDPWGNLRPCPHVPIIAGNLLEEDFQEIWHSPTMEHWREGLLAQCNGCSIVDECRSGCLAQAMWRNTLRDPLIRLFHGQDARTPQACLTARQ